MRKPKFTDSQIMDAVKRVEAGFTVPDICRELGISMATFYKWRAKYGGTVVAEGTPEQIAAHSHSHTGKYLSRLL